MTERIAEPTVDIVAPDVSHLITEDDAPVDNWPSEKQQRLLVEPLYSSWQSKHPFVAAANVGIFTTTRMPAIVPDVLLSLDVELAQDWWAKEHRSYFLWEFGKPPNVVVEIVSNKKGEEIGEKFVDYARLHVDYYVIYDPQLLVQDQILTVHELHVGEYLRRPDYLLPKVGLELTLWTGSFEEKLGEWVRWCTLDGALIPTGAERAAQEHNRAEQERRRAERLAAKLKELGIDPDTV